MHRSLMILSIITRPIFKEIHKFCLKCNKMQLSLKFIFSETKLAVKTDPKYLGHVPRPLLVF